MSEVLLRGLSRRQGEACLSDLKLDQLALGEMQAQQQAEAEKHLSRCAACESARSLLANERAGFAVEVNTAQVATRILQRAGEGGDRSGGLRRWMQFLAWPTAVSAAAALGLFYLVPLTSVSSRAAFVRAKGANLSLSTYVKFAGQDQPGTLHMGQPLSAGDRLQFRVSTTRPGHLAILSVDSRREISVFYPPGERAARVPAGREQSLETAVELDDSPGQETVVALLCDKPQAVSALVGAARAAAANGGLASPLVQDCVEARTTLTKKTPGQP